LSEGGFLEWESGRQFGSGHEVVRNCIASGPKSLRHNFFNFELPTCTPSKDFEKLDHKNAIKHEIRGLPPRFSHNPKYPPQKKNDFIYGRSARQ
jgi:hypothetical protein